MDLQVEIDFHDDVTQSCADWTEEALVDLIRLFADHGISTIRWLGHGRMDSGLWDRGSYFDRTGKAHIAARNIPEPLALICQTAHSLGLKVVDVIKPFDMAFDKPSTGFAKGMGPRPPVGLETVSGEGGAAADWLRDHPDCRAQIHPSLLTGSEKPISRIRLWHEDDTLPKPTPVRLFVSEDNDTWVPCVQGMCRQTVRPRRTPAYMPAPERRVEKERLCSCIEWSGLSITEPYVAVVPQEPWRLANTLFALLEMQDDAGDPIVFTKGIIPFQPGGVRQRAWNSGPVAFDCHRGTGVPRCFTPGVSPERERFAADELPFIAAARGRNVYAGAVVEPACPEVIEWVGGMIDRSLADGVDGIDIRHGTHTETHTPEDYGFGPLIVEAFQKRHGIDITQGPFDRALWRELRGDFMDQFIRAASERTRRGGAAFLTHINDRMLPGCCEPCYYETAWHTCGWIWTGMLDGVTFKQCGVDSPIVQRHAELCAQQGVRRSWSQKPRHAEMESGWIERIERAEDAGFDAFILYECAGMTLLKGDGSIHRRYPRLWQYLSKRAGR